MAKIIDPKLLKELLALNQEEMLIPLRAKKEKVGKILAIQLSDEEAALVQALQDFLVEWGYLDDNSFESLFIYLFYLACSLHKLVVEHEARIGRAFDPGEFSSKPQNQ